MRSPGPPAATPRLAVRGIRRSFGDVEVLHDVSLSVGAGEVRAILGENGAGKSTLVRILGGAHAPHGGSVELDGEPYRPAGPAEAIRRGVSVVHQEQAVVPGLTVAENVLLGHPVPTRMGRVRWRELDRQAAELLAALGRPGVDPGADAAGLTVVDRTMVAMARALLGNVRVLVLDEPTASLSDAETREVFAAVRRVAARGVAVLYVSHRLDEVLGLCGTYTVLRDGAVVDEGPTAGVTVDDLVSAMAGRPVDTVFPARSPRRGEVVLDAAELNGDQVRGVGLAARSGTILGIAGLAGSGRSEILRLLAGAQDGRASRMRLDGAPFRPRSVRQAQEAGVVLVPQDRHAQGLLPDTIERNVNLTTLGRHTVLRSVVARRAAARHAAEAVARVKVRGVPLGGSAFALSGGNQQRVVLAKYLALTPRVLLLDEPTRGVDVHTKMELYRLVRARAEDGVAVVVVSSELAELVGWCDEILVLHEGRSMGTFPAERMSELELLRAAYGRAA